MNAASDRGALFISHANPEDNDFAIWLGNRLSALGYEVWADVLRLRGGQDWQRELENALRIRSAKILLVANELSVAKQGVRNEIQIAHNVGRAIGDHEFIIPLRLGPFEAPFLIAHAQYIDFSRGWAAGLTELVETLVNNSPPVARPQENEETAAAWKSLLAARGRPVVESPEILISNWLPLSNPPRMIHRYAYPSGMEEGIQRQLIRGLGWPFVPHGTGLITFCNAEEIDDSLPAHVKLRSEGRVPTTAFLDAGCESWGIKRFDARNLFSNLLRQAIERDLRNRGLRELPMSGGELAWWHSIEAVGQSQMPFSWPDSDIRGRRQICGFSEKRSMYWHYGLSFGIRSSPVFHVRARQRVIFTPDGATPKPDSLAAHRLRRSFTKSWRNARWRDLMLAFLHRTFDGVTEVQIPVNSRESLLMNIPPMTLQAMKTVLGDAGREDVQDDDEEDDEDESVYLGDEDEGDEESFSEYEE